MTSLPSEDHSIKGAPSARCDGDGDGVKAGLEVAGRDQRRRRPHEKLSTSRAKGPHPFWDERTVRRDHDS